jgi:hypothetical protein
LRAGAEVHELRSQIRAWRRGRADTRLVDAISDAYIAVFAALMLGSMAVNVVLNVRRVSGALCSSAGCVDARSLLPWVVGGAAVTGCLALARLFGPMFVSPAVGSWLLPTPADRSALLRPRLLVVVLAPFGLGGVLAAAAATLGGFHVAAVLALTASVAALSLAVVCYAVVAQTGGRRGAQALTWLLALVVWAGLLLLALDALPATAPPGFGPTWAVLLAVAATVAVLLAVRAFRALGRLGRHQLTPGGALVPSLSGALATLDLALVYDVLVARRWRARSSVRAYRGGPGGPAALVWRELIRLRRTPQVVGVLAAALVVPYLATTAGLGRVVVLVAAATGFVAGVGLLSGLRVLTRTPGLARNLPFPTSTTRAAAMSVPVTAMVLFGLGTTPALHDALGVVWSDALSIAVATGTAAAASAVRWVTGRPPDYSRPLVSTPAGAVPTNLYGSALRGFDVLLLTTAPLLLAPTAGGALISLGLAAIVLTVLATR